MDILKGSAALLSATLVFVGCSSSVTNTQKKAFTETELLQIEATKIYKEDISVINNISSLQTILNNAPSNQFNSIIKASEMTPAYYFGPSISISEDEYDLKAYTEEPLLFSGSGIRANLPIIFFDEGNINKLNTKAHILGYDNLENMFNETYKLIKGNNPIYVSVKLKDMIKKELIAKETFSASRINNEAEKIVDVIYSSYFIKEDKKEILPEWFYFKNGKKETFTESDYKPYGFVVAIIKDSLSKVSLPKEEDDE